MTRVNLDHKRPFEHQILKFSQNVFPPNVGYYGLHIAHLEITTIKEMQGDVTTYILPTPIFRRECLP